MRYHWLLARTWRERQYRVGPYCLDLPAGHWLDAIQTVFPRYDTALAEVARLVWTKYPDSMALDIGANIGDSAALMRLHQDMPVICVEGDPRYLAYLRTNAARIGGIAIEPCYVGDKPGVVPDQSIRHGRGTASIVGAADPGAAAGIPVRPIEDILVQHSAGSRIRLLKTDTDGYDFDILASAGDYLGRQRPVVFFEYDIHIGQDSERKAESSLQVLQDAGYHAFAVFANNGEFVCTARDIGIIRDLNIFLKQMRGRFDAPVRYFDICAFSQDDIDLAQQLRVWVERSTSCTLESPP